MPPRIHWGAAKSVAQNARNMNGRAPGTVADLMAAGEAVGGNDRVRRGLAHGGEQRKLAHGHGNLIGVGAVAEGAGHAAAARFDCLHLQPPHQPKRPLHCSHGAERLLVAVAVQQHLALAFGDRLGDAAGLSLAREKFLEQDRPAQASRSVSAPGSIDSEFVAQREQAGGLEADDGHTARDERGGGGKDAAGLGARLLDQASGEKRAPAAQGRAGRRPGDSSVTR